MVFSTNPFLTSLRDIEWGRSVKNQRVFEITASARQGKLAKMSTTTTEGSLVGARTIALVAFSGGHLKAPPEEILSQLNVKFKTLSVKVSPIEHVANCLTLLKREQIKGLLEHCLVSILLVVNIDETRVWVGRVGSNGILTGKPEALRFISTDQRDATLQRQGIFDKPQFPFPETELIDNVSSMFELRSLNAYESFFINTKENPVIVVMNKSTLPFGPWSDSTFDIVEIWSLDAAWKHGLAAHGVVIGDIEIGRIGWSHDCQLLKREES